MRYKKENHAKKNGVVYTPASMADYVAAEMLKYWSLPDTQDSIAILDPAVGEGALLNAMLSKISKLGKKIIAVGYETDKNVAEKTQRYLEDKYPSAYIDIRCADFLDVVESGHIETYDLIIANPPYVRTQILGSEKAQKISDKLNLTGRVDIYYAFIVYTKNVMKKTGVAGYITSNKFMTIKAGNSVRDYMLKNYKICQITDLGDTKLFSASVLPCIIIFNNGRTDKLEDVKFTSVYEINSKEIKKDEVLDTKDIFDAIYKNGVYEIPDGRCYKFKQGILKSSSPNYLWTLSSDEDESWINKVESNTWLTFADIGKIRVGIKTTADNVFIGDDWSGENADLEWLRPLITHRNAGQIVGNYDSQWKVLYTHTIKDGKRKVYDIDKYPKTKKYLMQHIEQLSSRKYVLKANRKWYEIWVPQNPSSWAHRKIVFRDISEEPTFWLDESGSIVNGDCYWIDINENISEDIIYLALAVANSSFIEKFYDIKFNTKLYSGKRRYQTQYVEQFPIPYNNSKLAEETVSLVKKYIAGNKENRSGYKELIDKNISEMFSH